MGKRSNRNEFSFAVGKPEGPRSLGWRVWSNKGSSDVYLRTVRGQDYKVSLHDPYVVKPRRPWNMGATPEWMAHHNHSGQTHKNTVEWGPYGGYPPGIVEAVEIVVPTSELWISDHAEAPPDHTYWHAPPAGDAAGTSFVVAFVPPGQPLAPKPASGGTLIWSHELANGHTTALAVWDVELTKFANTTISTKREVGMRQFLHDLELGRYEAAEGSGYHGFSALHPLPPVGHLLTILEFSAIGFWLPAA